MSISALFKFELT